MKLLNLSLVTLFLLLQAQENNAELSPELQEAYNTFPDELKQAIEMSQLIATIPPEGRMVSFNEFPTETRTVLQKFACETFIELDQTLSNVNLFDNEHQKDEAWIAKHFDRFGLSTRLFVSAIITGLGISAPFLLKQKIAYWFIGTVLATTIFDTVCNRYKKTLRLKSLKEAIERTTAV